MDMRCALGLALLLAAVMPAPSAADVPRRLFVYGDSLAVGTEPYLPGELSDWRVKQDVEVNRFARNAAPVLRGRGERLSPVIHLRSEERR